MTTTIILDASAVNALFPEGSEARVELGRTVHHRLVKLLSEKEFRLLDDKGRADAERIAKDALRELGVRHSPWNTDKFELSEATKICIRKGVQEALEKELNTTVAEESRKAAEAYRDDVHARVQQRLDTVLDTGVTGRLKTIVRDLLGSILTLK